jgi:hypothetical protein
MCVCIFKGVLSQVGTMEEGNELTFSGLEYVESNHFVYNIPIQ